MYKIRNVGKIMQIIRFKQNFVINFYSNQKRRAGSEQLNQIENFAKHEIGRAHQTLKIHKLFYLIMLSRRLNVCR